MERVTLEYKEDSKMANIIIKLISKMGVFKIRDTEPCYNPEFVEKIKRAEKQESKLINLSDYGISL